jgi:hypothetical protein
LQKVLTCMTLSVLCAQSIWLTAFAIPVCALSSSDEVTKAPNEPNEPNTLLNAKASLSDSACKDDSGDSSTRKVGTSGGEAPLIIVDDVTIEGNRLVATEDIMRVIKTKRGDRYDRDLVIQDLRAINALGYFDDRSLRVDPELTPGGILIKIRVQEIGLKKGLTASFSHAGVNVSHYVPVCSRAIGSAQNSGTGTSIKPMSGFADFSLGSFNGQRAYRQFSDLGLGSNTNIIKRDKSQRVIVH